MNHYELLAIVSGRFAENEIEPEFGKIEALIKKYGGPVHYRQNLDRKRLAYPIEKQMYGYYFLVEFDSEPTTIAKLDRELKLSSEVLRHNLVRRKTVGKPRTQEHKSSLEQEAFGKSFDRTKLGLDEVSAGALQATTAPIKPTGAPLQPAAVHVPIVIDEKGEETTEVASMKEEQLPAAPVAEEIIQPAVAESTPKPVKEKKTEQKVSFEELDAKLDDIFKNDIL